VHRRLDVELVRRGLVESRTRAADAVSSGRVLVRGARATSPARRVAPDEPIAVAAPGHDYVSRGGVKLAAALDAFRIDVRERRCLDAGASTGGFTDVLLRRGAAHVVAVDVGHGQLAPRLRGDPRVTLMERTNIRSLGPDDIPNPVGVCVADLSFISLRTVAPALLALAERDAEFVLLVKPQYEAGPGRVGKRGIVRDPTVRRTVLREVVDGLDATGLGVVGVVQSPVRGGDGNVEYLAHARRGPATLRADG